MSKPAKTRKAPNNKQEQLKEQSCNTKISGSNRVCVIITQKKNSSWVDDLDARERLRKCQRVFH